jgi:hypothetical protein
MKIYRVSVEGYFDGGYYRPKYEFYINEENAKKRVLESEYLTTVALVTYPEGYTHEYPAHRYEDLLEIEPKKNKVELVTVKKYRYGLEEYDTID